MTTHLQRLQQHLHQTRLLGSISSTIYYDQNTSMPAAGAAWRGEQLALLAGQLHTRQTSSEYAELLDTAETELGAKATQEQRRNLQLLQLELKRQRCLDPQLVSAITQAQSRGNAIWQAARARNDFSAFAPALKELIELRRQQASQLASAESIARSTWEILAQPFEPDVSKARLNQLFTPLKRELPVLLEKAAALPKIPPLPSYLKIHKTSFAPSFWKAGATTKAVASTPALPTPFPAHWDPRISELPPGLLKGNRSRLF